jgi:hypothetical protein
VLAALNDSPEWLAATSGERFFTDLSVLTGLNFYVNTETPNEENSVPLVDAVSPGGRVALQPLPHP